MKKRNHLYLTGIIASLLLSSCGAVKAPASPSEPVSEQPSSSAVESSEAPESSSSISSNEPTSSLETSSEQPESSSSSKIEESSSSSSATSSTQSSELSSGPLSSESSSSISTHIPQKDEYWTVDLAEYGPEFRERLKNQIDGHRKHYADYSSCLSIGAKAAAYPNASSSTFVPFYHGTDTTTTTGSCNREHTWPDSRGGSKIEKDPFVIRPTLKSDNSSRGNNFYGNGTSQWDPASCGFEAARGESARVILYAATAHYDLGLSLSNEPNDAATLNTMGKLSTLLEWNAQYPATQIEKQINNYLYENGYGRNPFVDHPEFANYIWDVNGLRSNSGDGSYSSVPVVDEEYSLVNTIDGVDGASLAIVSTDTYNGSNICVAMTSVEKSETLPWYIVQVDAKQSDDKSQMTCSSSQLAFYDFTKCEDGTYTIYNKEKGKYLSSYVENKNNKDYYSIELIESDSSKTNNSKNWEITMDATGSCVIKSTCNVYLEAYKGAYCGYQYEPKVGIYLYR